MSEMKKEMIIIAMSYYPNPSPVGLIAKQFGDYFKQSHNISVICSYSNVLRGSQIVDNGETIICLSSFFSWLREKSEKKHDLIHFLVLYFVKFVDAIKRLLVCNGGSRWFAKKAFEKLMQIHSHRNIDIVLSFSGNFASHLAAYRFKKKYKNVKWATYTSDLGSTYPGNGIKRKSFAKLESTIFSKMDIGFVTKEIYSVLSKASYVDRLRELPYLLTFNPAFNKRTTNVIPVLTYGGRFYSDIRNPRFMLDAANLVQTAFVFNLYTEGACQSIVESYSLKNKKIKRFNMVTKSELNNVYLNSDFLISMGNSVSSFQPSKIYEYISYGKPIIHFYYKEKDYALEMYPFSLQIKIGSDLKEAASRIETFINEMHNKCIDKDEVENIFYCNSNDNIKSIILGCLEKRSDYDKK